MPAREIARGQEAVRQAMAMPTLNAVRDDAGTIILPPGSTDREQRLFVIGSVGGQVYYLHGDALWECPRMEFLAGYQLGQIASRVYASTRWFIPVAQVIAAFTMSFGIGAAGALALPISVVLVVVKLSVFYETHRQQVDTAMGHLDSAVRILRWMRDNSPITYAHLGRLAAPAAWAALTSVPAGINSSDIAAALGRLLGGVSSLPQLGLGQLLRVLASTVTTFAGRLPAAAVRGTAANAQSAADGFIRALPPNLANVDRAGIQAEFTRRPELTNKIRDLEQSLRQAAPVLQALATAFQMEAVPELRR